MRQQHRSSVHEASVVLFLIFSLYFVIVASSYLPFFSDDALISLRYSHRLLSGEGLTFNAGERVEGYSNLLWVLMVAGGGLVHTDLVAVARVLGLVCTIVAFVAVLASAGADQRRAYWPAAIGVAALAASQSVALWAIGGLEQPLQLALLAAALTIAVRLESSPESKTTVLLGAVLALLVLTRPDGLLFVAAISLGLILARGASRATIPLVGLAAALPLVAWAGQLAFRLWYYGDWVPNTARVKLSWSVHHTIEGAQYLGEAFLYHAPVLLLAAVIVSTSRPFRRAAALIPISVAILWSGYVASIGGDIFPGHRFFLPILAAAAVALGAGWSRSLVARFPMMVQGAIVVATMIPYVLLQANDPENLRARGELWEWDCRTLAKTLQTAFKDRSPLIAADPVGCIGYFGEMPTLDLNGLNDRHIARARPQRFGQGWIGHEVGDGAYALARRPDLVLLCNPYGSATGCFPSGTQLIANEEFHKLYVPTTIAAAGRLFPTLLWARVDSQAIGVMFTSDMFRLPGFLFTTDGRTQAVLKDGRLVARLAPQAVVHFDRLPMHVRTWQPQAIASQPLQVSFENGDVTVEAGAAGGDLAEVLFLNVPATRQVDNVGTR